jgi:dsRNA-specific ribonuclease
MNRKFVKENKKVLREFISSLLASMIAGQGMRKIQKLIDKDPVMKAKQQRVTKLGDDIRKRLEKYKKTDPAKYAELKKVFGV